VEGAAVADQQPRPVRAMVRDVRSVWGEPLTLPLGPVTVLVGPNRAGTSSVLFALSAAADDTVDFDTGRDLPWGRDGRPKVVLEGSGRTWTACWDPHRGTRSGDTLGHAVRATVTDTPRDTLRRAPVALARPAERRALERTLLATAARVLPEITTVEIEVDATVRMHDARGSELPVPQARALAAIGTARHLAETGRPPGLVAVESPDAFLHPAAQERMASLLVEVATETPTPVVVSTASPFVVPRVAEVTVVSLAQDADGRTGVVGTATGDEPQAALLGGLLRDTGLAGVLDRLAQVPSGTRAVLVVEGGTDEAYLRLAADRLGRRDLFEGVVILPSSGAMGAALDAILLRAEVAVPTVVLLDHDDAGRRARDTLVSRFGFTRSREVMTYADVVEGGPPGVEAETLFEPGLLRGFVAAHGPGATTGERIHGDIVTVVLTSAGKSAFVDWARAHARAPDLERWGALLDLLAGRLAD
jgi:hypothetical protein